MVARTAVSLALVALLAAWSPVLVAPALADPGSSEKTITTVASFDGHEVPITVYRPLAADAAHPVPVILHSHGWSGHRETGDGAFPEYVAAGFGVVSIDMRGHGDARTTSAARVMDVNFEIRDVEAVMTYVATLPWVQLDGPGDARLGAMGGSYGGAYQLLTAALDPRLDVIAPEITWNDLVESLAPNGAPKSAWIDLLYGAGNALARVDPEIHEAFAYVESTNSIPDGTVPGIPDLKAQFTASSPKSYPSAIDVPTLFVQGAPDTLFNFNQAVANYRQVKATGAPVRLVTHLGGHILNTNGTIPVPAPVPVGLQPPTGPSPCGSYTSLSVAWFQRYLLHEAVATGPEVCLALEDGGTVSGDAFPLEGTRMRPYALPGRALVVDGAPEATRFPVLTATRDTTIAGIPTLRGTWTSVAPDAIVFWTLEVTDASGATHVVDSQVTPQRRAGAPLGSAAFALDLSGAATKLHPGDRLDLVASGWSDQYAHNAGRVPGTVTVSGLTLSLPVLGPREHGHGGHGTEES